MPCGLTASQVAQAMESMDGGSSIHGLHMWTIGPDFIVLARTCRACRWRNQPKAIWTKCAGRWRLHRRLRRSRHGLSPAGLCSGGCGDWLAPLCRSLVVGPDCALRFYRGDHPRKDRANGDPRDDRPCRRNSADLTAKALLADHCAHDGAIGDYLYPGNLRSRWIGQTFVSDLQCA